MHPDKNACTLGKEATTLVLIDAVNLLAQAFNIKSIVSPAVTSAVSYFFYSPLFLQIVQRLLFIQYFYHQIWLQ